MNLYKKNPTNVNTIQIVLIKMNSSIISTQVWIPKQQWIEVVVCSSKELIDWKNM